MSESASMAVIEQNARLEKMEDCPRWDKCTAPLCPRDPNIRKQIWYPDEEICRSQQCGGLDWIRAQRKIKRRAENSEDYFTLPMLQQGCIVRTGIRGLNPNDSITRQAAQEKKWLIRHPRRRELSDAQREAVRKRFQNHDRQNRE